VESKLVQFVKRVWQGLIKLNIFLLYNPGIILLDIYPKELETWPYKILTHIFTATLFKIAKTWKQPRCLSVDKWVNYDRSRKRNIIDH
jgi:hypothetical protein